jgi:hypothetical protein
LAAIVSIGRNREIRAKEGEVKMRFLSDRDLNTIRGKAIVGHATRDEIISVFEHLDDLELKLDEADEHDMLGTEGWRHWVGYPETL